MKIEIELPEIKGHEYTGEYRAPKKGEWFLCSEDSSVLQAQGGWASCRPILKKKAPVYTVLGMNDIGVVVFGADIRDSDEKFVSMNAYEDALELISHIHGTDQAKLDNLKEILK